MNLKHVFTKKEIALILVLSLVLIGLSYYRFIYLRIGDQIEQYSTSDLKDEIQIEQAKALKKKNMQEEIDTAKSDGSKSELVTYDNKNNEYNLLNDIFELALGTSISFEQPYATGNTVRRNVNVSFTTIDYAAALVIISQLYDRAV